MIPTSDMSMSCKSGIAMSLWHPISNGGSGGGGGGSHNAIICRPLLSL